MRYKNLILDSDGVFTDGSFYYTEKGKVMKKYGPDDADALVIINEILNVHVISGDKRGFKITKARIERDMGLKLSLVSTFDRLSWIEERYNLKESIYMGDGIFDSIVFSKIGYSIAPANSLDAVKSKANYVTKRRGGEGAVAEACLHIIKKYVDPKFDLSNIHLTQTNIWKKNDNNKK